MEYNSGAVSPVESFKEGWQIIESDYWVFFSMTLVSGIIIVAAAMILGTINNLITVGLSSLVDLSTKDTDGVTRVSASAIPQLIGQFFAIFVNIIIGTISGAFSCGIFQGFVRKVNTGAANFGDLFSGFGKVFQCLVVSGFLALIQFLIGVVSIVFGMAVGVSVGLEAIFKNGKLDPTAFGGLFLIALAFGAIAFIIQFLIQALTVFVYPLLATSDLSGGKALILSIKAAFSNLGGIILLIILQSLLLIAGALLCLIGIIFVLPVTVAAVFTAYRQVFGIQNSEFGLQTPPPPPLFNQ